ncbi:MAG: LysE family translocator [Gammaproteobacteria bacterium]
MLTGENILAGLVTGLAAGIQPGPLAALVVREASRHGFAAGARVAFAPMLSDGPIVLGVMALQRYYNGRNWPLSLLAWCGAFYCLWLAWQTLRLDFNHVPEALPAHRTLGQAVMVNLLNPNPYIFWLTVGAAYMTRGGALAVTAFVFSFLTAIVSTKIGVAWLVARASTRRLPKTGVWIGRALALALIVFALRLFHQGLTVT